MSYFAAKEPGIYPGQHGQNTDRQIVFLDFFLSFNLFLQFSLCKIGKANTAELKMRFNVLAFFVSCHGVVIRGLIVV